jgi:hypothetical protein
MSYSSSQCRIGVLHMTSHIANKRTNFLNWKISKCLKNYIYTAQDSMQQERRNSIHHNRESLFQPSGSMECWGSWRCDRLASEGSSEAEMDSNEAKLGSEVGNQCNDGRGVIDLQG